MLPTYWLQFVDSHKLSGREITVAEEMDLSGVGADLGILTPEQSLDEQKNFWPGIGVAKDGYVPVAWCSIGSGDYYYINTNDGPHGPLYRIYHDAVHEAGYEANDAVAVVLEHFEELLKYV